MKCAIVAQARGEEYLVNQWIAYHLMLGFDKIFLFDHLSDPPLHAVVDETFANQIVLKRITKDVIIQRRVYDYASQRLCKEFDWIAFIDLDEFIVLKEHNNIKDFLNKFPDNTGCVLLHWECFTSQGYSANPEGCIFDNYTQSIAFDAHQNHTVKSIAKQKAIVQYAQSVHIPEIDLEKYTIRFIDGSEPGQEFIDDHVNKVFCPPNYEHWDKARIYHFMILSDEQVQKKRLIQQNTNIKEAPTKYTDEWIKKSYPDNKLYINSFAKDNLSQPLKAIMKQCTGIPVEKESEDITETLFKFSNNRNKKINGSQPSLYSERSQNRFPFRYIPSIHEKEIKEYFDKSGSVKIDTTKRKINLGQQNYIVCFSNRCGSNFLCELLSMDKQIGNAGESFNYQVVMKHSDRFGLKSLEDYAIWLINHVSSSQKIFGTKLAWEQLYFLTKVGVIPNIIKSPKIIHIYRKDILGQAISLSIASQTEQWTSLQSTIIKPDEVKFRPRQIINLIDEISVSYSRFVSYFSLFNADYVGVAYEDLVADPTNTIKEIVAQLGIVLQNEINIDLSKQKLKPQSSEINERFRQQMLASYALPKIIHK